MADNESPETPNSGSPPAQDQPADGQSSESSAEAPQSSEPDSVEQSTGYPQVDEMIDEIMEAEVPVDVTQALAESVDFGEAVDQADIEPGWLEESGCGPAGCFGFAVGLILVAAGVFVVFFGSDASPQDASQTESNECPEGGLSGPVFALQVAFAVEDPDPTPCPVGEENADGPTSVIQLNADGLLTPIPGNWHAMFGAGTMTCAIDTPIQASTDEAFLEVLDDGERVVLTDSNGSVTLDRQSASPTEAVYFVDLSDQAGMEWKQTLVFTSSNTVEIRIFGCPEREGEGYLVEAQDEPSPGGQEAASPGGQGEASTTGLFESCAVDVGPNLTEVQLDELVACFEPHTGVFIVEGLPDLDGTYFTSGSPTKGHGADPMELAFDGCWVNDGLFLTDTTTEAAQVWMGVQDGSNVLVGVQVLNAEGLSHDYGSVDFDISISANRSPGENEWAGWTTFETLMYNKAAFFPNAEEFFDGDPAYNARITLVCG